MNSSFSLGLHQINSSCKSNADSQDELVLVDWPLATVASDLASHPCELTTTRPPLVRFAENLRPSHRFPILYKASILLLVPTSAAKPR